MRASLTVVLLTPLGRQSSATLDGEFLASAHGQGDPALFHHGCFGGLSEGLSRWRTFATNSPHLFARAFSDSFTLCIDIFIQAASFELLALIGLGKVFADLLGNAHLFGKGGVMRHRLHQVVLGR